MTTAPPIVSIPAAVAQGGPDTLEDAGRLFPAIMPDCEALVWRALDDATHASIPIPEDAEGAGIFLPAAFDTAPALALFPGMDESYPPVGGNAIKPIPILRGSIPRSIKLPAIGVALAPESEDGSDRLAQGGFAGDLNATDEDGKIVATCAYYAEPLFSVIIVELIHENRDERDRLHNHIRARLYPLRHLAPETYGTIKELQVQSEKQELPIDEQPLLLYVSIFTVEIWSEALMPTTVLTGGAGVVGEVTVNVEALKEA